MTGGETRFWTMNTLRCSVTNITGLAPYNYKPGESGNPVGRRSAGAYIKEWINSLIHHGLSEKELRDIRRDKSLPASKRIAAERILRAMESPDLADFDGVVDGQLSLRELRAGGVDTTVVKKNKTRTKTSPDGTVEVEREIELHDRSGSEFDRVMDRTEGKPAQEITVSGSVDIRKVEVLFVGDLEPGRTSEIASAGSSLPLPLEESLPLDAGGGAAGNREDLRDSDDVGQSGD